MIDSLDVGRTLGGALACLLPIGNGLSDKTRFGVVMGDQLGLRLDGFSKSFLQHLRNLSVVLLARTLQQRLIGRILNECMLEEIARLRQQPSLIHQLSFD